MNTQALTQQWDQLRQKYGVYLRLLETIPESSYHVHLVPGIRTPAEMVVHVSGTIIRDIARGVAQGRIESDESTDGATAEALGSKAELLEFATIGDAQLNAMVPTPWNMTIPGWVGFSLSNDEFLHHRGQLSVFARLCGVQPPFIWGFAENAPEFRPAR